MKMLAYLSIFGTPFLSGCQQSPKPTTQQIMSTETYSDKTASAHSNNPYYSRTDTTKLNVPDSEWRKILSPEMYAVAREAGTERAFTGKYWNTESLGNYYCAVCGNSLFRADQKFASSCGWPSFFEPARKNAVEYKRDLSYGMDRVEVLCGRCLSHLGHVLNDGPRPT